MNEPALDLHLTEHRTPAAEPSRQPVVTLDQVSITYPNKKRESVVAVRDFSLSVNQGEVLSLVGPSGCGKTSLLRAIAGLRPLAGGEIRIRTAPGHAPFAVVFQQPSLLPWRTALQNAAYGVESRTKDRRLARERARSALALVGLGDYEDFYPGQLSGGMQQRVNVARAIAVQPAVLLLDEPFASLDAQLRDRMQTELLSVLEKTDATALFVTHQVDEAVYLADRVAVMTSNPGALRAVVDVRLSQQKELRDKRDPQLIELCDEIWNHLSAPGNDLPQRSVASGEGAPE